MKLRISRAVSALTLLWFSFAAGAADKPNVVLMLSDNIGYGELGVYGCAGKKMITYIGGK